MIIFLSCSFLILFPFPLREQVHKVLAGSHWEDLGSKVMIGIKRIMDIAMP